MRSGCGMAPHPDRVFISRLPERRRDKAFVPPGWSSRSWSRAGPALTRRRTRPRRGQRTSQRAKDGDNIPANITDRKWQHLCVIVRIEWVFNIHQRQRAIVGQRHACARRCPRSCGVPPVRVVAG
jgi:hypothetical protein